MISISVVIPTYNRERYIKKSIESVLAQTGQGELFEISQILVIDDGSTDETRSVVSSVGDERIIFHKTDRNSGAAAARNLGVSMASGEWIAFQDSDDIWHADKLEKQVGAVAVDSGLAMVSHKICAIVENGGRIITPVPEDADRVRSLAAANYIGTPTMLVKKVAFDECGGFDERLRALEDWDFALRFADRFAIGMVDEPLIDVDMILEGISADASKYYESRCKMISWNRDLLLRHDCFNEAAESLLMHAQENNVLESVAKMLELYLGNS